MRVFRAGRAEMGDRLGRTRALGRIRVGHDDEPGDRALIDLPGEDRGPVGNAGIVQPTASGARADTNSVLVADRRWSSVGFSEGPLVVERTALVWPRPLAEQWR